MIGCDHPVLSWKETYRECETTRQHPLSSFHRIILLFAPYQLDKTMATLYGVSQRDRSRAAFVLRERRMFEQATAGVEKR